MKQRLLTVLCIFLLISLTICEEEEITQEEKDFFKDTEDSVTDPEVQKAYETFKNTLKDAVYVDDVNQFENHVTSSGKFFIAFVDSLQKESQDLAGIIQTVVPDLKKLNVTVLIIDVSVASNFRYIYEIQTTPLIRYAENGIIAKDYSFPDINLKNVKNFIRLFDYPLITEAKTFEEVEKINKDFPIIFGIFPSKNDENFSSFNKTAFEMDRITERFVYIIANDEKRKEIFNKYIPGTDASVILLQCSDYSKDYYPFAYDTEIAVEPEILFKLLGNIRLPIFDEITEEKYSEYYTLEKVEAWFLFNEELYKKWKDDIIKIFLPYRSIFVFFWLNIDTNPEQAKAMYFTGKIPDLTIGEHEIKKQYFYDEETFTKEGIEKFVKRYLEDKLTPFVFSETLTKEEQNYSYDKIGKLSAKNFNNTVSQKDIKHFVFFTAETCDFCKSYEEIFISLSKEMKDEKRRFYTFDVSKNQVPENAPDGIFPHIGAFYGENSHYFVGVFNNENVKNFILDPNETTANAGKQERFDMEMKRAAEQDPQKKAMLEEIEQMAKSLEEEKEGENKAEKEQKEEKEVKEEKKEKKEL